MKLRINWQSYIIVWKHFSADLLLLNQQHYSLHLLRIWIEINDTSTGVIGQEFYSGNEPLFSYMFTQGGR